ncbi:hypothetical protein DCC62_25205 [candidate division KSB1 bacterium]|nr:MAG: hypothetical protein DCC62_25205 [candidate division KSB1 bacterium]
MKNFDSSQETKIFPVKLAMLTDFRTLARVVELILSSSQRDFPVENRISLPICCAPKFVHKYDVIGKVSSRF